MTDNEKDAPCDDVVITMLHNNGDHRGDNFMISHEIFSLFGKIDTMHVADILPGALRGNHYHIAQKEILLVIFKDSWEFGWGACASEIPCIRKFSGSGGVLIQIPPHIAHALKNTGRVPMTIAAIYSEQKAKTVGDQTVRKILLK